MEKSRFHIERLEERIAPQADATLWVTPTGLEGRALELQVSEEGCLSGIAPTAARATDGLVQCTTV